VREVEGGRGDKDFGGGRIGNGFKGNQMVRGIRKKNFTCV